MSGGGQNTVTQNTLPPQIAPYLTGALQAGQNLYQGGGPAYYGGQQVADLNPMQLQGINQVGGLASDPNNPANSAAAANQFETSGALLNPSMNPYLQDTFHQAANSVQNQLSSEFAGAGSNVTNSLPVQSDEMNNLATQLYGGAYQQGLQQMTQASALAPGIEQAQYMPSQELLQTGAGMQQQSQNEINAEMAKYNWNTQLPYNMLSWYSGLLGQNAAPFQGQSSSANMTNNPWLTGAGLGVTGYGLMGGNAGMSSLMSSLIGSGAVGGGAATLGSIGAGTAMADIAGAAETAGPAAAAVLV